MALTKRAIVLFDEQQYKRLYEYAEMHKVSVGSVIRESIEAVISGKKDAEKRKQAALRLTTAEEDPMAWVAIEKIIARGHVW